MAEKKEYKKRNYERGPRIKKFVAEKHCGKPANDGNPCTLEKGFGTEHLGTGFCKFHGGNAPVSIYTQLKRSAIKDALVKVREGVADPLDLTPELELLRGIVLEFHDRYEEFKEGILAFKSSYDENMKLFLGSDSPLDWAKARAYLREAALLERPKEVIDVAFCSVLIDRVGKMVERMHKMKMDESLTPDMIRKYRDALVQAVIETCTAEQIEQISKKLEGL